MRDRKLAIQVAESVQSRLAVDSSSAESCKVFASSLEIALSNWNRNVERLDGLTEAFVASVQQSKLEGEDILAERRELARQNIELLEDQLQGDLNIAIQHQQAVLSNMGEQMAAARNVSEALVKQLDGLQYRLTGNSSLASQNSSDTERGI